MQNKYVIIVLAVMLAVTGAGLGIQTARLARTIRQCEYYRTELESATNREQIITNELDNCFVSAGRTAEILRQSGNTIQDIRRQLEEVRDTYQNMEMRLLDCYDRLDNFNSGRSN